MSRNIRSNPVFFTLCIAMSSSAFAADHGGFLGMFKKKKSEPVVMRAIPVMPDYNQGQGQVYNNSSDTRPYPIVVPYQTTDREWKPVVDGTIESINNSINAHFDGLERTGIGSMFGPKSAYAKLTPEQQKAWIEANKKPGTFVSQTPERTSCIDFVLKQLRVGYAKAGKLARFNELKMEVVRHNGDGLYLLKELEKDGWTMVYWNPDVKNPSTAIRTNADPQHNHRPEDHIYTAQTALGSNHQYFKGTQTERQVVDANGKVERDALGEPLTTPETFPGININQAVTNFRPTNPLQTVPTIAEQQQLQKFENAPLFVGIANGGYHVFLGSQGKIIESHSTRNPTQASNIEVRDFTGWGIKSDEGFGSGVMAVPPGSWQ